LVRSSPLTLLLRREVHMPVQSAWKAILRRSWFIAVLSLSISRTAPRAQEFVVVDPRDGHPPPTGRRRRVSRFANRFARPASLRSRHPGALPRTRDGPGARQDQLRASLLVSARPTKQPPRLASQRPIPRIRNGIDRRRSHDRPRRARTRWRSLPLRFHQQLQGGLRQDSGRDRSAHAIALFSRCAPGAHLRPSQGRVRPARFGNAYPTYDAAEGLAPQPLSRLLHLARRTAPHRKERRRPDVVQQIASGRRTFSGHQINRRQVGHGDVFAGSRQRLEQSRTHLPTRRPRIPIEGRRQGQPRTENSSDARQLGRRPRQSAAAARQHGRAVKP
jgi:hypothetical protein